MTCRVPTAPIASDTIAGLDPKTKAEDEDASGGSTSGSGEGLSVLGENGPPYTPITFALQGTLQKSHLHIWTDMNVLAHNIPQLPDGSKRSKKEPKGYMVAGTAYSVPEFEYSLLQDQGKGKDKGNGKARDDGEEEKTDEEKEASAVAEAAREPWTAGHGTKAIRGEPLTFSFHVSWIEGGRGIGWPGRDLYAKTGFFSNAGPFTRLLSYVLVAMMGMLYAQHRERIRNFGRRRPWQGDGILGVPPVGKRAVGVSFGNGGKTNGYGGYSAGSGGYGGFSSGKRD